MQRIQYYDTLRFLAIFGVIAIHVFQTWNTAAVMNIKLVTFSEIFKCSVPIFLMISGALLLSRDVPIKEFLKKRFARLTYPFIFYMIIYVAVLFLLMTYVDGFSGLRSWLAYVPLNYNWYFWLIIGLYLTIPILSKYTNNTSIGEMEYFIAVILIGSVIYQVALIFKVKHYVDLTFFLSPVAYLILGYYLANKDFKWSPNRIITIALVVFIFTTLCKMSGHILPIPIRVVENYEATRSFILASYIDVGTLQILQASSVFVICRYVYESKSGIYSLVRRLLTRSGVYKFILSVSMASYGMYLFHHTLIEPMRILVAKLALTGTEVAVLIVCLTVAIFLISWIVVLILSCIPKIGKISGYH